MLTDAKKNNLSYLKFKDLIHKVWAISSLNSLNMHRMTIKMNNRYKIFKYFRKSKEMLMN